MKQSIAMISYIVIISCVNYTTTAPTTRNQENRNATVNIMLLKCNCNVDCFLSKKIVYLKMPQD